MREKQEQLDSLKKAVALITKVSVSQSLTEDQTLGLFRVLSDYSYALDILDKYDHQVLAIEATTAREDFRITYSSAITAIQELRAKFRVSNMVSLQCQSLTTLRSPTEAEIIETPANH